MILEGKEKTSEYDFIFKMLDSNVYDSESLASYIVAYKYLNINKDFAVFCMNELSRRRNLGEDFDFESFIEDKLKSLPKIENETKNNTLKNIVTLFTNK